MFTEILYRFEFEDLYPMDFHILLHEKTSKLQLSPKAELEDWTLLEHNKCSHCPLSSQQHTHCPAAVGIAHMVEDFKDMKSVWKAKITVITSERQWIKEGDIQTGLFSLFGLVMATSGCPHMNFLRPLARFHLPFSTQQETLFRVSSVHLLKQYFLHRDGEPADWTLERLAENYEAVAKVNEGMLGRIQSVGKGDSQAGALLILDNLATHLSEEVANDLSPLRELFHGFDDCNS